MDAKSSVKHSRGRLVRRFKYLLSRSLSRLLGVDQVIHEASAIRTIVAHTALQNLLSRERYANPKTLQRYGFRVYSQGDEDGILQQILERIGTTSKRFLEIGVGHGQQNNTLFLLLKGWSGVWIDGSARCAERIEQSFADFLRTQQLVFLRASVNRDNINVLAAQSTRDASVDVLSIDIDGNDYHVLKALTSVAPRVIIVEYNAKFTPPMQWVMPYDLMHTWDGSDYFGASLKSYELMLATKGYGLVGCSITGINAFFVRDDLRSSHFCAERTAEFHYESSRFWLKSAFRFGLRNDLRSLAGVRPVK